MQKLMFRRNITCDEMRSVILESFASFQLEGIEFLRCGKDNMLSVVEDMDMNRDVIFEVAGQGSIYVIASSPKVNNLSYLIVYNAYNFCYL